MPILALGAIGFGFAMISVVAGALTGPARYNRAKADAYECGIEPSPQAAEGGRFPVKYFLTAMLFIIFDVIFITNSNYFIHLHNSTPKTQQFHEYYFFCSRTLY